MFLNRSSIVVAVCVFGMVKSFMPKISAGAETSADTPMIDLPPVSETIKTTMATISKSPAENLSPVGLRLVEDHITSSKSYFKTVGQRIDYSVKDGALVHIEDGEPDDHWHCGVAALGGKVPHLLLLRGGHWLVRKATTLKIWKVFVEKFGVKKPEIRTIHGDKEKFAWYDGVEGSGAFSEEELNEMREKSNLLEDDPDYIMEVTTAKIALKELLHSKKHVTIVLKTAPTGLAELIQDIPNYKERITIVWMAAVSARQDGGGFTPRFNFEKDLEGGDKLIALGVPIILLSPALSFTAMNSIVDKELMHIFNKYSRWESKFEGFDQLQKIAMGGGVVSKIFEATQANFMQFAINNAEKELLNLKYKHEELNMKISCSKQSINAGEGERKELAALEQELLTVDDSIKYFSHLGIRWKNSLQETPEGAIYRDYCAVDQFAHVIVDETLREKSVLVVFSVDLIRDRSKGDLMVEASLNKNGHVLLCSHVDSGPLCEELQKFIYWMVNGEPSQVKNGPMKETVQGMGEAQNSAKITEEFKAQVGAAELEREIRKISCSAKRKRIQEKQKVRKKAWRDLQKTGFD